MALATLALTLSSTGIAVAQASTTTPPPAPTPITLTATTDPGNATIPGDFQGFSVESADFAHGYLTRERMSQRLKTLGKHGVIRLGGYSMDLVWPAFGEYKDAPAPAEAIGGTVDQSDLDKLKPLLQATGWKATLGVPLKKVIDPSKIKNPLKDPSPALTMDQVVAEVVAAHKTLGDDLLSVEIGNEFDNVTTLTGGEMWETLKQYKAAIDAALPDANLKLVGPSANTAATNTKLEEFVTGALADTTTKPEGVLAEVSSHLYPGSHCGSSNLSIAKLMSSTTYTKVRDKLNGIMDVSAQLGDKLPMTINESNSASCSGQPNVSNSYATSLWSLDYMLQTAQSGIKGLDFHTNTAAICGDFQPRASVNYPISYRYYGAFCADDQAAFDAGELSASPLYYGIWAFRQVPQGTFVDLDLADSDLSKIRAYGVKGPQGKLTIVLINVQDPAAAESTANAVTLNLPAAYENGRAVTLQSSADGGFASLDATAISLGGRTVAPSGIASGTPQSTKVDVQNNNPTATVEPGTAQIITFN